MEKFIANHSLLKYNSFGIEVKTRYFYEFTEVQELIMFLHKNQFRIIGSNYPLQVIGSGSNILFTEDFRGIVVHPKLSGIEKIGEDTDFVYVKAAAGENWDNFVAHCVEHNWGGIENLSGIPGEVGSTPVQNIGAYGVEIKDVIEEVETIEIGNPSIKVFLNSECDFQYRNSIFKTIYKSKYVIVSVTVTLQKRAVYNLSYGSLKQIMNQFDKINLQTIRQAIKQIRKEKLPDHTKIGNAGSFFKNPTLNISRINELKVNYPDIPTFEVSEFYKKISAAWLIEKCGWKGKSIGNVGVYEKQPLVIVNYGGATGKEILNFALKVKKSVYQTFGIMLENEVNIL